MTLRSSLAHVCVRVLDPSIYAAGFPVVVCMPCVALGKPLPLPLLGLNFSSVKCRSLDNFQRPSGGFSAGTSLDPPSSHSLPSPSLHIVLSRKNPVEWTEKASRKQKCPEGSLE